MKRNEEAKMVDNNEIYYRCDRRKCERCDPGCYGYTDDIRHAKNFILDGKVFAELTLKEKLGEINEILRIADNY